MACVAVALLWSSAVPMSSEQSSVAGVNKKLVEVFYKEILNGRSLDAAGKFIAEDCMNKHPGDAGP